MDSKRKQYERPFRLTPNKCSSILPTTTSRTNRLCDFHILVDGKTLSQDVTSSYSLEQLNRNVRPECGLNYHQAA